MMTVKEAAERAGVCASVVYDWVNTGALAHYRLGKGGRRGNIRIAETDLLAFLHRCRVEPERPMAPAPPPVRPGKLKHLKLP